MGKTFKDRPSNIATDDLKIKKRAKHKKLKPFKRCEERVADHYSTHTNKVVV